MRRGSRCLGSGLLTPGPELPSPLELAADSPGDLRESIKTRFRRACNLTQGADAIMIDIIRINCMSRKTVTMHLKKTHPTQILILERPKENIPTQQWFSLDGRTPSDLNLP